MCPRFEPAIAGCPAFGSGSSADVLGRCVLRPILHQKKMSETGEKPDCADPLSFAVQEGPAIVSGTLNPQRPAQVEVGSIWGGRRLRPVVGHAWRGADSNRRPRGNEPRELPLLHRASGRTSFALLWRDRVHDRVLDGVGAGMKKRLARRPDASHDPDHC